MAITNRDRVDQGFVLLRDALARFVPTELQASLGPTWMSVWHPDQIDANGQPKLHDPSILLHSINRNWNNVFSDSLPPQGRSYATELANWRNDHAHFEPIDSDDAIRVLDTAHRLLEAIHAEEADEIEGSLKTLRRTVYDEQARRESRKVNRALEGLDVQGLKPWREIIRPHEDVREGKFEQAEFAANLWKVQRGQGRSEYVDPVEFFRRTYLTDGLSDLLKNALKRTSKSGGDSIVEMQINFGGGKTHSLLALWHLFSGTDPRRLLGIEELMKEIGITQIPTLKGRVAIIGNYLPATGEAKDNGTKVNTLWGEIAWQLGGQTAYEMIRESDEAGTDPGGHFVSMLEAYSPCIILIDEWVAYARELVDRENTLPAGEWESQRNFAQTLSEAASTEGVVVVVSIPKSVVELGSKGAEALQVLKNTVLRNAKPWAPATAEESFEIVRRRLFDEIHPDDAPLRDATIRDFVAMYANNSADFPSECREQRYFARMQAAYPIHPELFDRLYEQWSGLERFHRTRGVLRLMANVIHVLWSRKDPSPLILPSLIPLDERSVRDELLGYLDEPWAAVIDSDIEGLDSTAAELDSRYPNLKKYDAATRVARSIFLAATPSVRTQHKGVETARVKLSSAMPKQTLATFGEAMLKLGEKAAFIYQEGERFWFDTQPSLNRKAQDYASAASDDQVESEIASRLKELARERGHFSGVHVEPDSRDIPDDHGLRLVILGPKDRHLTAPSESAAQAKAKELLEMHGAGMRQNRNRLVFLAADDSLFSQVQDDVRSFLAWKRIVDEAAEGLFVLPVTMQSQAKTKVNEFNRVTTLKLLECYQWLIVPIQLSNEPAITYKPFTARVGDRLADRSYTKLKSEQKIASTMTGKILAYHLENVPLWNGDWVSVETLLEHFSRYCYLPRLQDSSVLYEAIQSGVSALAAEHFGYATNLDDNGTPSEVTIGERIPTLGELRGYILKPDLAIEIAKKEQQSNGGPKPRLGSDEGVSGTDQGSRSNDQVGDSTEVKRTRFFGVVTLPLGRLAGTIADINTEVLQRLSVPGAEVKISIEIEAANTLGYDEKTARDVRENCSNLGIQGEFDPR